MKKITVKELAAELRVSPNNIIDKAKEVGIRLKRSSESMKEDVATQIRNLVSESKKKAEIEKKSSTPAKSDEVKVVSFMETLTVKEFAEAMGLAPNVVLQELINLGSMATINELINFDAASIVGEHFGFKVELTNIEEEAEEEEEEEINLKPRPPIVTIMGHVDHGKTTLLDTIRKSSVAEKEAGGITQHIGAYQVVIQKGTITFIDTPGHEAFSQMRARGAQVTDIVILVVAADDGVMPQTIEAINHAKDAGVPIVVAVNKIDVEGANPEKIKQELTAHGLVSEEWGGETIFCEVSAKQNIGIDQLLEMMLLVAEMKELKANPDRRAVCLVTEAKLDKGRGAVATIIVKKGTLKMSDPFVCGIYSGKVRAMFDAYGKKIKEAGPSTPVEVLGFDGVPGAGDTFVVVENDKEARRLSLIRQEKHRVRGLGSRTLITLEDIHQQIEEGVLKELKVIIKADVMGSVQAIKDSLEKIENPEVEVKVIHGSAGAINEADITLAVAANAIILAFSVRPTDQAIQLAAKEKIEIRQYSVIYHLISDIQTAMEGMLDPVYEEEILGKAEIRQIFSVPKIGVIGGSYVLDGTLVRDCSARLIRDNIVIYTGTLTSLNRFKDSVKEVSAGFECGIGIDYQDIKEKDIVEAFKMVEIERK
ncbi:MAG: translation initiation factor IF-2 [Nitrospinae bacterium]|nr:translation initiation factor IF-2 [Nitrospinota bacterium]